MLFDDWFLVAHGAMPVLHRNSINGKFYVRTAFSGVPVTFQTKHWCHQRLSDQHRKEGDEISWRDFYDLWEAGGLWTRAGKSAIEETDPLFTWAELEKKIADLSKQLVEIQIKNDELEAAVSKESAEVSSLEAACHQWSDAYNAIECDLMKARDQISSVAVALHRARLHRKIALTFCLAALLVSLGSFFWRSFF